MENKLIIFDLDDTLLNSDRDISEFSLNVLKKVQKLGHFLVVNTARSLNYSKALLDKIKPDYSILNGGALIFDKFNNIIYKNSISPEMTNNICKELLKVSSTISVQTFNDFYVYDDYKGQNAVKFDFLNNDFTEESLKILACSDDEETVIKIANKYSLEYISYFNGPWRRMNAKNVSKWSGVLVLLNYLNNKVENTISFGDDLGDLEMINNSNVGVLMKNAKDELKSEVKLISEYTNEEDGVCKFLEKYFNLRK